MADLLDIQGKLSATNAALTNALRACSAYPGDVSARLNLQSLERRQRVLEESFLKVTELHHVDVCSYRIIPEDTNLVTVGTMTSVLGDFQKWVSLVFHALKNGPLSRANIPQEVADNTSFGFAYAFPGSAGFVLTLDNEQLLFGESELDEAIRTILEMAKKDTPDDIVAYARKLGAAPIRAMNSWAEHHAKAHTAASIDWRRGTNIKNELFMQEKEFQSLHQVISAMSDTSEDRYVGRIELRGANLNKRTFVAMLPTGNEIHGHLSPGLEITEEHTIKLPYPYNAEILTRITVQYATEEEKVERILLALNPITS